MKWKLPLEFLSHVVVLNVVVVVILYQARLFIQIDETGRQHRDCEIPIVFSYMAMHTLHTRTSRFVCWNLSCPCVHWLCKHTRGILMLVLMMTESVCECVVVWWDIVTLNFNSTRNNNSFPILHLWKVLLFLLVNHIIASRSVVSVQQQLN